MQLSRSQLKHLKALSHNLKPVVIVGSAGLTDAVLDEIDTSIEHHELIKVKINAADKPERQAIIDKISEQTAAGWVLSIGHIAAFYRPAEKPKIVLP